MKFSQMKHFHHHNHEDKCTLESLKNAYEIIKRRGIASANLHEQEQIWIPVSMEDTRTHANCLTKSLTQVRDCGLICLKPADYVSLLHACVSRRAVRDGKGIHAHVIKVGFEPVTNVANSLIDKYGKCGRIEDARQLFGNMPQRDPCSWTSILTGYVSHGRIEDARDVFDKMPERSVISWNAMIAGYAEHGHGKEALHLYCQMQRIGMKPDGFTFGSVLSVCACMGDLRYGKEINVQVIKLGSEVDVFVGTALVDMYAKCGSIEIARQLFDEMPVINVVSWTAMIVGYAQNWKAEEATRFFLRIHHAGYAHNSHGEEALKLGFQMHRCSC